MYQPKKELIGVNPTTRTMNIPFQILDIIQASILILSIYIKEDLIKKKIYYIDIFH